MCSASKTLIFSLAALKRVYGFPVRFSLSLSLFFFAFEIKKERKAENLTRNPSVYSLFIFSFTVSKSLEEVKEREDEEK